MNRKQRDDRFRQIGAAVLLTRPPGSMIADMVVMSSFLGLRYPRGTEWVLVYSISSRMQLFLSVDSVYWYAGRVVVIPQEQRGDVDGTAIIERLQTPI